MSFDATRAHQQAAYAKEFLSYKDIIVSGDINPDLEERLDKLNDLMQSQFTERMRSAQFLQDHNDDLQSIGEKQGVVVFAVMRAFEQLMPEITSSTFDEACEVAKTYFSMHDESELAEDRDSLFLTRAYLTGINYLIKNY